MRDIAFTSKFSMEQWTAAIIAKYVVKLKQNYSPIHTTKMPARQKGRDKQFSPYTLHSQAGQ